jgi:CRISPR-associated protein (TIGR02584 family)
MSPAVLTETVWALAFPEDKSTEPIVPDEVVAITTTDGDEAIGKQLFGPDRVWDDLRAAVLGESAVTDKRLCLQRPSGAGTIISRKIGGTRQWLKDISNEEENTATADFIIEKLWGYVEKPETRLIASISGGFKTMSALLFSGMSLLGRKDDLITHVLVNAPYDTSLNPRFFFPSQKSQPLVDRDGKIWMAADARIRLGLVPFVALHDLLEKYQKPRSYSELVARCRANVAVAIQSPIEITIGQSRPLLIVNRQAVKLSPREHLVMLFLAKRSKDAQPALDAYGDGLPLLMAFRDSLKPDTAKIRGDKINDESDFTHPLSSLRVKLRKTGGNAERLVSYLPERGRLSLNLPANQILIED